MDNSFFDDKGDLIKGLLNKCEADSLPQVYMNFISSNKNKGIATFSKIFTFNNYFLPENIQRDLKKNQNLIILSVYPNILKKLAKLKNTNIFRKDEKIDSFRPIKCIATLEGMAGILQISIKKRLIPKTIFLKDLEKKFEIADEDSEKFWDFLKAIINERKIFGIIELDKNTNEHKLITTNKISHPSNRRLIYELIITLSAGVILLFFIIYLARPII